MLLFVWHVGLQRTNGQAPYGCPGPVATHSLYANVWFRVNAGGIGGVRHRVLPILGPHSAGLNPCSAAHKQQKAK